MLIHTTDYTVKQHHEELPYPQHPNRTEEALIGTVLTSVIHMCNTYICKQFRSSLNLNVFEMMKNMNLCYLVFIYTDVQTKVYIINNT